MKQLRDYVASGKPVVGIRTASHAFCLNQERPPAGLTEWPEFDRDVLGGNHHMHHGNKDKDDPFTCVWAKEGMESHAILAGVPTEEFRVPSWLYKTSPLAKTATVLMMGRVGDRKPFEPVTWTNINTSGGRVFYTSLGHPGEFKMRVFRRLLTNGIFWALNKKMPSQGQIASKLLSGSDRESAEATAVRIARAMAENDEIEDEDSRNYVLSVLRKVVETSENESAVEEAKELIERMSQ
jgi:type 1 glutamine amidotransferase